jgi:lipopolysaccharide/colanic/teichoic acid biosynthesis glycosyltransferase
MSLDNYRTGRRLGGASVRADSDPRTEITLVTKRVLDIVIATIGLLLFSPILIITSITIKLDSRGPVFCRETLYGYKNRSIRVFKFRSMTRLSNVSQALRRTGMSDLPRLFNVLRGDMSIVGPCLYANRQDTFDCDLVPLLKTFKPGITGLAQMRDCYDEFVTPTAQRFRDDLKYIGQWSLSLDIQIILMTLFFKKALNGAHGGDANSRRQR